jgi:hypothetical protein
VISFTGQALWFILLRSSVIGQGILRQPGSDAFDVLCYGRSQFKRKALELFALSLQ